MDIRESKKMIDDKYAVMVVALVTGLVIFAFALWSDRGNHKGN